MPSPKNLSVVIPLYNETARFPAGFKICQKFYQDNPSWEFIFVNDGSTDGTENLVKRSIKNSTGMKLVSYAKNQGKGYALKQGIKQADRALILISDIDFSVPLSQVSKLYEAISEGADVAAGSRRIQGAEVSKHQPFWREWLGARFTDLSNLCLGLKVSDFTCGFKLFRRKAAKKLFRLEKIKRWGYDAEILFLAKRFGYKLKEVPVSWQNDERTRVSLAKDIFRSLLDLVWIRLNAWRGSYSL